MSIEHVEVLVEEPSAGEALRCLLPRILGATSWEVHEHRGKRDLLARLPARLKGYRAWLPRNSKILVLVDRDNDDCRKLKKKLEKIAHDADFLTQSIAGSAPFSVINRIAVEELEAWYFGDWDAVCAAYPRVDASVPAKARYRKPDAVTGGTCEAFERVLQDAGYFETGLRKIEAARVIAAHMEPLHNMSPSFRAFRDALLPLRR